MKPWEKMDLNGTWKVSYVSHDDWHECTSPSTLSELEGYGEGSVSGDVPVNFELALEKAGVVPEIYKDQNVLLLRKYEGYHVFYSRTFEYTEREDSIPELVFEGLDTICEIWLNGKLLGKTDNMFVSHSFRPDNLIQGTNEIIVHFLPVCVEARKYDAKVGHNHMPYNFASLHIRKAPHMYGWDIMPRIVSCGIYRPVWLVYRPKETIKQSYVITTRVDKWRKEATLNFFYEVDVKSADLRPYTIEVEGTCEDSRFFGVHELWSTSGKMIFDGLALPKLTNVKLWEPKGKGIPYLYDVKVTLKKQGEVIDTEEFRTGIRTVELESTSLTDAERSGKFNFKVNGEKVFILGTNFVSIDAFHSRDRERLPKVCELLEDSGCNAIRLWGGNIYEDDYLYDFCDEHGILIWQDFMMACGFYPQDEEMCHALRKEATAVVRRLRHHPSILLWAGDNEVDFMTYVRIFGRNPNQNKLTREVLPEVLWDEDPTRPYLPSSPYIDGECVGKKSHYFAEQHLWGPRDYFKHAYYSRNNANFASEMGYHGCNSPASIRKFISEDKIWPWQDNSEWLVHATSPEIDRGPWAYRIELMAKQIRELFGYIPDNLEDFSLGSQISQAEAMKFFVELFRLDKENRGGLIWWNLIDGWPQFSDAVVDYYFEKKLAYYYIKNSQKPLLLTFDEPANWGIALKAINDTGKTVQVKYEVKDYASGEVVATGETLVGDEVLLIEKVPYSYGEQRIYVITWETETEKGMNHYLCGQPAFDLEQYRNFLQDIYQKG